MKLSPPVLPQNLPVYSDLKTLAQDADTGIEAVHIKKAVLTQADLSGLTCKQVWFDTCDLTQCNWKGTSFYDCRFSSCNLSNGDFSDVYCRRCTFEICKMVGLQMPDVRLNDVKLASCNLTYTYITHAKFHTVFILSSDFSAGELCACTLKNTKFENTTFLQTSFFKTSLQGIDLRSCRLEGLLVSHEHTELRGAIVDIFQAAALAKLMGLEIKDS